MYFEDNSDFFFIIEYRCIAQQQDRVKSLIMFDLNKNLKGLLEFNLSWKSIKDCSNFEAKNQILYIY